MEHCIFETNESSTDCDVSRAMVLMMEHVGDHDVIDGNFYCCV
jgi:hypothetical protein